MHGDKGRYTHKSGSKWIRFKTGPLSGGYYKGKHVVDDGTHTIEKWVRFENDPEWWWMSTCSRES